MTKLKKYANKLNEDIVSLEESIAASLPKSNKRKKPLVVDIGELISSLMKVRNNLFSPQKEEYRLLTKGDDKLMQELCAKFESFSKEDLIKYASEIQMMALKYSFAMQVAQAERNHLLEFFKKLQTTRIENNNRKQTVKEKVYKNNNEYLDSCIKELEESKGRPLKPSDFSSYMNLVTKNKPPFKSKIGEPKEDKDLSEDDRNIHRTAKEKRKEEVFNGWSEGTIRKRWEDKTKLKATLKKVSTLK